MTVKRFWPTRTTVAKNHNVLYFAEVLQYHVVDIKQSKHLIVDLIGTFNVLLRTNQSNVIGTIRIYGQHRIDCERWRF